MKGQFIRTEKYSLEYLSENNIKYELLEGLTLGNDHALSSDIIFIMVDEPDYDAELADRFVGWIYGATFINEPDIRQSIEEIIGRFEKTNADWIIKTYDQKGASDGISDF